MLGQLRPHESGHAILFKRGAHRRAQHFIPHGLGEEIRRAGFHRLDADRHIAIRAQEDDRQRATALGQRLLEFEAVEVRHLQIEQQAARYVRIVRGEELDRRGKHGRLDPHGMQQSRDGLAHRRIVIDHENGGRPFVHARGFFASGRVK